MQGFDGGWVWRQGAAVRPHLPPPLPTLVAGAGGARELHVPALPLLASAHGRHKAHQEGVPGRHWIRTSAPRANLRPCRWKAPQADSGREHQPKMAPLPLAVPTTIGLLAIYPDGSFTQTSLSPAARAGWILAGATTSLDTAIGVSLVISHRRRLPALCTESSLRRLASQLSAVPRSPDLLSLQHRAF